MTDPTRPGWIRRVRAVVTGDTTDTGDYRLHVDDGQPDDRDRATAALLIANARAVRPAAPGGTVPTSPHHDDDRIPVPTTRPRSLSDLGPGRATLPDRDPGRSLDDDLVDIPDDLLDPDDPHGLTNPQPDPLTDSGIHHVPDPDPATTRVTCNHCGGTGYTMRTVSELLRESIALIPADGGQTVIREFYRRLLTAAPDLAPLFPQDLITAATDDLSSPGRMQRDKLLQALAALADLYGTSRADRQRLDTALRAMGRSHAAFARPDGTVRGATIEEYMAVKQTLMDTLHSAAGDAWRPEYDAAWAEAYDYAAVIMLHEQMTSGMTMPRYPRPNQ